MISIAFTLVHIDISVNKIITWLVVKGTLNLLKLSVHVQKKILEAIKQLEKNRPSSSAFSVNAALKKKRFTDSEQSDFIKEHNINNYLELLAIAEIRKEEGKQIFISTSFFIKKNMSRK